MMEKKHMGKLRKIAIAGAIAALLSPGNIYAQGRHGNSGNQIPAQASQEAALQDNQSGAGTEAPGAIYAGQGIIAQDENAKKGSVLENITIGLQPGFFYTDIESENVATKLRQYGLNLRWDINPSLALLVDSSIYDTLKRVKTNPDLSRDYTFLKLTAGPLIKFGENLTVIPRYRFISDVDHLDLESVGKRAGVESHGLSLEAYAKSGALPHTEFLGTVDADFARDGETYHAFSAGAALHFPVGFVLGRYIHAEDTFSSKKWDMGEGRLRLYSTKDNKDSKFFIEIGGTGGDQNSVYGGIGIKPITPSNKRALKDLELNLRGNYIDDRMNNATFNIIGLYLNFRF